MVAERLGPLEMARRSTLLKFFTAVVAKRLGTVEVARLRRAANVQVLIVEGDVTSLDQVRNGHGDCHAGDTQKDGREILNSNHDCGLKPTK
ncbi:unnamed protein product [Clonostachys rosea f. rosea IK726]|uniref:Uncharacterized protein n=1 Tax=Clonostachys rosea f. rosea IK726 TaxID=1349383 RepID=A0ACA9U0X7_BIOOC|nr:unnamed protein product [Clonostachys rosea f. rosea IK726]